METSEITYHKDGAITFAGPDAVEFYRASVLATSLRLYAKAKIIPTRGMNITRMLALATRYTGRKYKRTQAEQAADDVQLWARTMKAALPTN